MRKARLGGGDHQLRTYEPPLPDSTHLKFIKLGTPCIYFVLFTLNFYVPFRINLINSYIIYII